MNVSCNSETQYGCGVVVRRGVVAGIGDNGLWQGASSQTARRTTNATGGGD